MTHPYKYILYSGGDTITVNEDDVWFPLNASKYQKQLIENEWKSSCKTIKIAEGERHKFTDYAFDHGEFECCSYDTFIQHLKAGIQIPPELVRIESILIKQLPNLQQWQELAYFVEEKEFTDEKVIDLIAGRIRDEFHKHKELDWAQIAARKIHSQWIEYFKNKTIHL